MSEIRNFSESLLYHTVTNSQVNLSHESASQRSAKNLFNDLNKTYSSLTVQTAYQPIQNQFQSRFIGCLPKTQQPEHSIQQQSTQQCATCTKTKRQLRKVQLFLKSIENNFIQKELLLINRFTQIYNQLSYAKQQIQKYKGLYMRTLGELDQVKEMFKPPKIDLICTRTYKDKKEQKMQCLSTMQSNCDPLSKRHDYIPIKNHNRIKSYHERQKDIHSNYSILHNSSDSISVSLEYTESDQDLFEESLQSQRSKETDPHAKAQTKPVFIKTKSNNSINIPKYPETQLANSKSYNSSLCERSVKPKKLASKIFNLNRN